MRQKIRHPPSEKTTIEQPDLPLSARSLMMKMTTTGHLPALSRHFNLRNTTGTDITSATTGGGAATTAAAGPPTQGTIRPVDSDRVCPDRCGPSPLPTWVRRATEIDREANGQAQDKAEHD
jgi:hypothetical protein